jgi:hypothetical protein
MRLEAAVAFSHLSCPSIDPLLVKKKSLMQASLTLTKAAIELNVSLPSAKEAE